MNKAVFIGKDGFKREEVIRDARPEMCFLAVDTSNVCVMDRDSLLSPPVVKTRRFAHMSTETTHIYKEI